MLLGQETPRRHRRAWWWLAPAALAVALPASLILAGGDDGAGQHGASARVRGITVSPVPGARGAAPETEISLLGASRAQVADLTTAGSRSGGHPGRLVAYASERGVSFVPAHPFAPGERVIVAAAHAGLHYSFTVSRPVPLTGAERPPAARRSTGADAFAFASRPDLAPARVSVQRSAAGGARGYLFVAPLGVNGAPTHGRTGPLIVDSAGSPVWQAKLAPGDVAMNFHPQTYGGRRVLAWWEGRVSQLGFGLGRGAVVDTAYRPLATIDAGNGYSMDLHELLLTPRRTALITAYRPVRADLRRYGGRRDGELLDSVVQEIDVATGRVMLEWDPLDHVDLRDSYTRPGASGPWDPFHVNSIDLDGSGHLLVSARNTWAVYDVSARTGLVEWRLGGKHSSFRLRARDRFAWQHDARFQPGGRITLFDNEAAPRAGQESRGLVLALDRSAGAAHAVTRRAHPSPLLSASQGNLQTLPNGNLFAGWGAEPYYSEFDAAGRLVYDARLPGPDESYRAFRAVWNAEPPEPPALAVRRGGNGAVTVAASWNGATAVARWEVLAGPAPDRLSPAASAPRAGFETPIRLNAGGRYVAVRALDASGRTLSTSPPRPLS